MKYQKGQKIKKKKIITCEVLWIKGLSWSSSTAACNGSVQRKDRKLESHLFSWQPFAPPPPPKPARRMHLGGFQRR